MATPTDLEVTTGDVSDDPGVAGSRAKTRRASRFGLLAVLLVPFLENLPAIIRLVHYEPQAKTSGIGLITKLGYLPGQAYLDPNVGFNQQALGHAAALAWLHGHVPWWNLNSGLGMPLAASIQSGSFFPPTLLQALPQGTLWFHIALECMIGWATYALLRELRCSPFAAAVGAIAFELNGAVAWITNAPANPVAFLPLCLLGVEYVVSASVAKRRGGWVLLALGVWLTIVSGFPEVAVLNSALVACWFVVRVVQNRRAAGPIVLRTAVGACVGLLLAAPLLNAFVRYLHVANLGLHTLPLATVSIPRPGLAMLISPYGFGGIFDNNDPVILAVWERVGGYTGVTMLVLAVAALFGARERLLRFLLAGWALLFLGAAYNVVVLHQIVENLPGLKHLAVFRYSAPSSLFCLAVLAAFFVDDARVLVAGRAARDESAWATPRRARRWSPSSWSGPTQLAARLLLGLAIAVGIYSLGFFAPEAVGGRTLTHHLLPKWYWGSLVIVGLAVLAILFAAVLAFLLGERQRRLIPILLGTMLAAESMGFFVVPILAFPRAVTYDTSIVSYLHSNLGTQRFYTVGPISPNYGSFYGVASLDAADLPIPKNWAHYVSTQLNSCEFPWQFGNGGPHGTVVCPTPLEEALSNLPNYEASGVKYLVTYSGIHLPKYSQPRIGGAATVDGGLQLALAWKPPSYLVGGVLTGMTIPMPGGLPNPLHATVCSGVRCFTMTPVGTSPTGERFTLVSPLPLAATSLNVLLIAKAASPAHVLTVPADPEAPSSVVADNVPLLDRGAIASFIYDPKSVPQLVHATRTSQVYALPQPAPIGTAPGCTIVAHSMTSFSATCAQASTLTYRELSFAG
ncbi:MAG TPA: hypothetical protein VIE15_00610, partial [Acidimicrobiales bacterium]